VRTKYFSYCFLFLILFPFFFFGVGPSFVSAQTLTSDERAQLETQLAQVEAEQAQAQQALVTAQAKSSSLQNDINLLAAKIKTEQLAIQANNLLLKTLGDNINTTQGQIESLDAQIAQNEQDVTEMFKQIQQAEDIPVIEILLSGQTLSDFLNDAITLGFLQQNIDQLSTQLGVEEASSTAQKAVLVGKQNATLDAQYAIQQAQKALQTNQSQEQQLLSISKNNESSYTALVAEKKKEADVINAKLFALAGGSNPIPFGTAYKYALAAQKKTGVDPAFLLAILTQESNLGNNQGTCYLTNTKTGAGVSVKTGHVFSNVMSPTRDVPPFLTITSDLGVDPLQTVVSCPQSVGWGGAMGPAQFIASTWMLLTARVASALGFSGMANPWNPQHAFMASALYLSDLGASGGGYTAEMNAACKYYSGSSCSKSSLVAGYGSSVMSLAGTIQSTEIDNL
jgi:membrane-bound lytic murein transglycosylase B